MDSRRKGQIQAVTVVLLTGITIGVASVVYVWGQPILDKRQSQVELDAAEQKILNLRQEIIRVSEAGEGAAGEVQMELEDSDYEIQTISVDESADYVDVVLNADQSPYPGGRWTMLKGDTMQNLSITSGDYAIEGQDLGSVLLVRPRSSVIRYRIEFRNLYTDTEEGGSIEKVDLKAAGGRVAGSGAEIYISNGGQILDTGEEGLTLSNGQTLDRSRTVVELDLG
jgi:hypothetical protein